MDYWIRTENWIIISYLLLITSEVTGNNDLPGVLAAGGAMLVAFYFLLCLIVGKRPEKALQSRTNLVGGPE